MVTLTAYDPVGITCRPTTEVPRSPASSNSLVPKSCPHSSTISGVCPSKTKIQLCLEQVLSNLSFHIISLELSRIMSVSTEKLGLFSNITCLLVFTKMEISTTSGSGGGTSCTLLEKPVGFRCLASLLGVGGARLDKKSGAAPDLRYGKHEHRSKAGTFTVDAFLQVQYDALAETLPDELLISSNSNTLSLVFDKNKWANKNNGQGDPTRNLGLFDEAVHRAESKTWTMMCQVTGKR